MRLNPERRLWRLRLQGLYDDMDRRRMAYDDHVRWYGKDDQDTVIAREVLLTATASYNTHKMEKPPLFITGTRREVD